MNKLKDPSRETGPNDDIEISSIQKKYKDNAYFSRSNNDMFASKTSFKAH